MPKFHHILIVEDDPEVLDVLRRVLEDLGYIVSTARSAAEALPLLNGAVDLLVADDKLYGMAGRELAKRAAEIGIPSVLMSGDPNSKQDLQDGNQPFIGKPFRISEFAEEVKRILAEPSSAANDR